MPTSSSLKKEEPRRSLVPDTGPDENETLSDIVRHLLEGDGEFASALRREIQRQNARIGDGLRERRETAARRVRKVVTGNEECTVRDAVKAKVEKAKDSIRELKARAKVKADELNVRTSEPNTRRLMDQYSFSIGLMGIVLGQYVMLSHERWFHVLYTAIVPVMYLIKIPMYKAQRMHYFLIDFCYFANLLLVIFLFAPAPSGWLSGSGGSLRDSCSWLKRVFVLTNGPLALAVPTWRVSLVFHDFDHLSSCYIHIFPVLVMFVARRFPHDIFAATEGGAVCGDIGAWDLADALGVYILWQLIYLFITEYWRRWRFESDPELQTSLRWLVTDSRYAVHQMVRNACRKLGIFRHDETFVAGTPKTLLIFCGTQLIYTIVTCSITPFLFAADAIYIHGIYCAMIATMAVHNGAGYYFQYFSRRYDTNLNQRWANITGAALGAGEPKHDREEKQTAEEGEMKKTS